MEFFLLSSLLLAASASASLLRTPSPNGDNGASQTNVTSPFVMVTDVCVATERRYSTPVVVLIGTNNQLLRCLYEDPEQCEVLYTTGAEVTALLVVGEFIYVGLDSKILRCKLNQAESCEIYQTCDSPVHSLAAGNGHLYAGDAVGKVFICGLEEINSCRLFHTFETSVCALMQVNEHVYIGLSIQVMRCSLGIGSSCTLMITLSEDDGGITGLSKVGNIIFALTFYDKMWKCVGNSTAIDSCTSVYSFIGNPYDLAAFDGSLYTVVYGNSVYTCQYSTNVTCTTYGNFKRVSSIAFAYVTYPMQDRYRSEDTTCKWPSESQCPPGVTYYNAQQRAHLEVQVKDGKLHNSQGTLVDTGAADEGHTGPAAIFAMGPDGRILLSNWHKRGRMHTSSFFAGSPVSGAGEMVVKDGKIQEIRACSDHYRPDTTLNRQVIQSLRAQGYTDHIDSVMCSEDQNQSESNVQ